LITADLPHLHLDDDSLPAERGVDQPPPVPPADPAGRRSASWTGHPLCPGTRTQGHHTRGPLDAFDDDVCQMRQQDPEAREVTPVRPSSATNNV
jgi:hypothetical protein